jgi:hypothetical protein
MANLTQLKDIMPELKKLFEENYREHRTILSSIKVETDYVTTKRAIQKITLTNGHDKRLTYSVTYDLVYSSVDDYAISYTMTFKEAVGLLIPHSKIQPKEVKGTLHKADLKPFIIRIIFLKIPRYYQSVIQLTMWQVPLITYLHGKVEDFVRKVLGYNG